MQNSSGNFKHGVSYARGKNEGKGGEGVNDKEKTGTDKKRDEEIEE